MARTHPEWKQALRRRPAPPLTEPVAVGTEFLGHCRMDGRVDGMQMQCQQVNGRYYLYVGHFWSGGVDILDVTDPANMGSVAFIPVPDAHTWHAKVQVADDILMISCEGALFTPTTDHAKATKGVRFFDVRDPHHPKELSFWGTEGGFGVHRSWWNGGRYAFLSHGIPAGDYVYQGRKGTRVLTTLDVSDPEKPRHVSDFWLPVQCGEGEQPAPYESFGVHEPVIEGDRAYVAYADGGFAIVDISVPEEPKLVSHVRTYPELCDGQTHTCVPLPEKNLLVVCEESMVAFGLEGPKDVRIWDISDEANPRIVTELPIPEPRPEEPYDSYFHKGERFGPHSLHDNHQGKGVYTDRVFNAYMNAGLRIWDISDPAQPVETASFVPSQPTEWADPRQYNRIADSFRGGTRGTCSQDVNVDPRGIIFLSGYNDGIWAVRQTP